MVRGRGEVTLGKGIKGYRQEVVIQSKFGVRVMKDMDDTKTICDNSAGYSLIWFILDYLPGSVVIAGVKNPDQLRSNLDAFGWRLDESEVEALGEVSSVRHFSASGVLLNLTCPRRGQLFGHQISGRVA